VTTKVRIPKTGMGISEGTVARWLKEEGEPVTEGEIIVEIETAKAMEEVPAPVSGVLAKILLAEGETAEVHTEIGLIESE
jgi:pyruvate/2-oxoglutarate dehydrogenase complex dihydrolipoamide acyltransferase (E2) component